ncbi:MAG: alpha/beta fold hydrolase [Actinobacteria bacterium]|nr:alpha/beta fold hydrolase [Actinomycetota bacterium]
MRWWIPTSATHADNRCGAVAHRALLFNGSGASIETSAPLINALAKTMQVLVHDQRGLGASSVPDGPYTMAGYAADGAALLRHVGWDMCIVVGISFGGMVAQEFAVTHPGTVEKLVLLCTSAGGTAGSSYPLHELASLPPAERLEAQMRITDSRFGPEWFAEHPVDAEIMRGMRERAAVEKPAERLRGERLQLEARTGHDVSGRLGLVTAPTYVLAGRFDGIAPPANSYAIASLVPDAVVSVYEGGHMFSGQDRNAILDIRAFVADGTRTARV